MMIVETSEAREAWTPSEAMKAIAITVVVMSTPEAQHNREEHLQQVDRIQVKNEDALKYKIATAEDDRIEYLMYVHTLEVLHDTVPAEGVEEHVAELALHRSMRSCAGAPWLNEKETELLLAPMSRAAGAPWLRRCDNKLYGVSEDG